MWRMRIQCWISKAIKHTQNSNTHCSSTATTVPRTHLNITLYVHCPSRLQTATHVHTYTLATYKTTKNISVKWNPKIIFCTYFLNLTGTRTNFTILWDLTPCCLVNEYKRTRWNRRRLSANVGCQTARVTTHKLVLLMYENIVMYLKVYLRRNYLLKRSF
jgi:hypothetical protein